MSDKEALLRIFRERRSVRAYLKDKTPSRDDVLEILGSARYAPNSCNLQHYGFIYVDDVDLLKKMSETATRKVSWAPALIVIIDDKRFSQTRRAGLQSVAAATQNVILAATARGLGTCWMAGFKGDGGIREILGVPDYYEVTGLMAIGYPDPDIAKEETCRISSDDYIHFNGFQEKGTELLSDLNVDHWPMDKLISYRERIGSVYAARNHIQLYQRGMIAEAADLYSSLIHRHKGGSEQEQIRCIDVASYDGCFIREMEKRTEDFSGKLALFASDYSPFFLKVIAGQSSEVSCVPMNLNHVLDIMRSDIPQQYDFISLAFKVEYLPETEKLLKALLPFIKKDGRLFLSTVPKYAPRAMMYKVESMVNRANMYENNKHYRFGPYRHLSCSSLGAFIRNSGWEVEEKGAGGKWPKSSFNWFWLSPSA